MRLYLETMKDDERVLVMDALATLGMFNYFTHLQEGLLSDTTFALPDSDTDAIVEMRRVRAQHELLGALQMESAGLSGDQDSNNIV